MRGQRAAVVASILGVLAVAFGGRFAGAEDGGTVYFRLQGAEVTLVSAMNPDGSGKATLYAGPRPAGGEVSRDLHGGRRWFLEWRLVPGEVYPGSSVARREVFAVRDDGAVAVRLTSRADLQVNQPRWSAGDAAISWTGSRWSGGVGGPYEIYRANVVYDAGGEVAGLDSQPVAPVVSAPAGGTVHTHDWSPDGTRMVLSDQSRNIWIANLSTGSVSLLQRLVRKKPVAVTGSDVKWSPDGSRIAYGEAGEIRTIAPDGSAALTLVSQGSNLSITYALPMWSPSGSDLLFWRSAGFNARSDVYRMSASGGAMTNLTADLDTRSTPNGGVGLAYPLGWR